MTTKFPKKIYVQREVVDEEECEEGYLLVNETIDYCNDDDVAIYELKRTGEKIRKAILKYDK